MAKLRYSKEKRKKKRRNIEIIKRFAKLVLSAALNKSRYFCILSGLSRATKEAGPHITAFNLHFQPLHEYYYFKFRVSYEDLKCSFNFGQ